MLAYAKAKFRADHRLNEVGADGKTLLETLTVVEKIKRSPPAELIKIRSSIPEFPYFLGYLWDWFVNLSNTRNSNGFGTSPITEQEIQAFCVNRRMRLCGFELDAIRMLDRLALKDYSKETDDDS